MRRVALAVLFPAALLAQQTGQPAQHGQASLADSVMMLNRAGQFADAARTAKRGLDAAKTIEEKCGFLIGGGYALGRMGESETAGVLQAIDTQCRETQAVRTHATDIAAIRAALASSRASAAPNDIDPGKWPPLPATGVDMTAIDAFYRIADILRSDRDPSPVEWNAMLATPGYQLVWKQNRSIRVSMATAFKPSMKPKRDSLLAVESDQSLAIRHLLRAYDQRDAVMRARDALSRSIADSIALGVRAAARYLPAGTTEKTPAPFIAFAVFADDGYALDGGVLLDPLFVIENGLVPLISHEFHHAYVATVDRSVRTANMQYDAALYGAIRSLRNEGIADQIDKPHPLPATSGALAWYPPRYNAAYDKTPALLKTFDSLVVVAADDSTKAAVVGQRARALFWSNGHPNGAYIAREIAETFGVDSLLPAVYDPFALLRIYAAAERKHGRPSPFSVKAQAKLDEMEKRYVRP